ncbi:actin cytoskeleton protein-like protein [Trichodelitschia bisporula]|uniref:Actin cytoskeleton protein-like protein n=1 Tax=Trichodelitschia bisporula TaxID=703511 RepID=A0A6G1HJK4_9PEZI|nr:actin cytoskeleton protein-like protein [Trichodelitschia bisporula]
MSTVKVQNISKQTSEKEVRDFFSFCGKISHLTVQPAGEDTQEATVTFDKETAAKTALLLDSTQLGPSQVHVTPDESAPSLSTSKDETDDGDVQQEDKPRARIFAEYLAHGYLLSDQIIARGLAFDEQRGISQRFTDALKNFDAKYHAVDKAKAADERLGVTSKAYGAWGGLSSYFEKASNTPTGQKLRQFYDQSSKQVLDVHAEARHLADLKTKKAGEAEPAAKDTSTPAVGAESSEKAVPA